MVIFQFVFCKRLPEASHPIYGPWRSDDPPVMSYLCAKPRDSMSTSSATSPADSTGAFYVGLLDGLLGVAGIIIDS